MRDKRRGKSAMNTLFVSRCLRETKHSGRRVPKETQVTKGRRLDWKAICGNATSCPKREFSGGGPGSGRARCTLPLWNSTMLRPLKPTRCRNRSIRILPTVCSWPQRVCTICALRRRTAGFSNMAAWRPWPPRAEFPFPVTSLVTSHTSLPL